MNTTAAAATEAHVTVATIRTWCRNGVIAANKTAGRWVIDTASLAHRIAIGAMRARKQAVVTEPVKLSREERQAQAAAIRDSIRPRLAVPALTGSDKQIPWAEEIRAGRIDEALERIVVQRDGSVRYQIEGSSDPLFARDVRGLLDTGRLFASAAELIAAVDTCLNTAGSGLTGDRTSASFWIDRRDR